MKHPMQKIYLDDAGCPRFIQNAIVAFLLDAGPHDMNSLARQSFSKEDREQFAQLIGYSISGFGELSYVSGRAYNKAQKRSKKLLKEKTEEPGSS